MTTRMEVCASLALAMMSQALPRARMAAPEFGGQKATRVTWEPHVSIFRRVWWVNSTLTKALRLYSGLLVGDHRHGDLVAEEPKASSIST